jgi:hypothetical protein
MFLVSLAASTGFGATIRCALDSDVGEGGRFSKAIALEWAKKTGNTLEYISRPNDATATLQQYQQYWAAKSFDVDVYMIDVIWQGIAAQAERRGVLCVGAHPAIDPAIHFARVHVQCPGRSRWAGSRRH